MSIGPRYAKHFVRPDTPTPFRLVARDETILESIARFRALDVDRIARAINSPVRAVRHRLKLLWRDAYVERASVQWTNFAAHAFFGGVPMVYTLTRQGAEVLQRKGVSLAHKIDRSFRTPELTTIAHDLQLADVILDIEAEAADHGLAIIDHADLLPTFPLETRRAKSPFLIHVPVKDPISPHRDRKEPLPVKPDRLLSVASGHGQRHNLILEWDTGSETIDPAPRYLFRSGNIRAKHIGYLAAFEHNLYKRHWGFLRQRVCFLTPRESRITEMLETQKDVAGDACADMFVYTTPARLAEHGFFGPAWRSLSVDRLALVPGLSSLPGKEAV